MLMFDAWMAPIPRRENPWLNIATPNSFKRRALTHLKQREEMKFLQLSIWIQVKSNRLSIVTPDTSDSKQNIMLRVLNKTRGENRNNFCVKIIKNQICQAICSNEEKCGRCILTLLQNNRISLDIHMQSKDKTDL